MSPFLPLVSTARPGALKETLSGTTDRFSPDLPLKTFKSFRPQPLRAARGAGQEGRADADTRPPHCAPWRALLRQARPSPAAAAARSQLTWCAAKGYPQGRDEDDTAVRGASHRGAAPGGDGLSRGETPPRASLSRRPERRRIPSSSAPVDEQPGQASINQTGPSAPTESRVRLGRGQKHRPGGAGGGRGRQEAAGEAARVPGSQPPRGGQAPGMSVSCCRSGLIPAT